MLPCMKTFVPQTQKAVLFWWQDNGRILPWREKVGVPQTGNAAEQNVHEAVLQVRERIFATYLATEFVRDPYRVVVAELMLQQTQVDRVLPKYLAWMKKWPTVHDLAAASFSDVLIEWQGLGYNRRARFLWLMAKEVAGPLAGKWPLTEGALRQLPGVGQYTARAVMAFAQGAQVAVVDTNIARILQRWEGRSDVRPKEVWDLAADWLPPGQADPWNQALMDFGALICTARQPKCHLCPVQQLCKANTQARRQGEKSFSDTLKNLQTAKKNSENETRAKVPFKQTDRYFRGRIVDYLRAHSQVLTQNLLDYLQNDCGLGDADRGVRLLAKLSAEKLIAETRLGWQLCVE